MENRSTQRECCMDTVITHKLNLLLELYKSRGASPQEWQELEEAIREFAHKEIDSIIEHD